jgi:hypothetical protein
VLCPAHCVRKTITKILLEVHQTALASGVPVALGLRLALQISTIARLPLLLLLALLPLLLLALLLALLLLLLLLAMQGLTLPLERRLARLVTREHIKMMWARHLASSVPSGLSMTKKPPRARLRVGSVYLARLPAHWDTRAVKTVLLERSKACRGNSVAICALKALMVHRQQVLKTAAKHAVQEPSPLRLARQCAPFVQLVLTATWVLPSASNVRQELTARSKV